VRDAGENPPAPHNLAVGRQRSRIKFLTIFLLIFVVTSSVFGSDKQDLENALKLIRNDKSK